MNPRQQARKPPASSAVPWIVVALLSIAVAIALAVVAGVQARRIAALEARVAVVTQRAESNGKHPTDAVLPSERSPPSGVAMRDPYDDDAEVVARLQSDIPSESDPRPVFTGSRIEGGISPETTTDWKMWLAESEAGVAAYAQSPTPTGREDMIGLLSRYASLLTTSSAPPPAHLSAVRIALMIGPEAVDLPLTFLLSSGQSIPPDLMRSLIQLHMKRPTADLATLSALESRWSSEAKEPGDLLLRAAVLWRLGCPAAAYDSLDDAVRGLAALPDGGVGVVLLFSPQDPEHSFAQRALALMLAEEGRLRDAAEIWRWVLRVSPKDARGWDRLGCVLSDMLEENEAEAAFRRALSLDAGFSEARLHMGLTLMNRRRWAEAMIEFDLIINDADTPASPGDKSGPRASAHFARAICLFHCGQTAKAEIELKRSLSLDPTLAEKASEVPVLRAILEKKP